MQENVTKQWFKRFESEKDAFEISFDPINLTVNTKLFNDGKVTENAIVCKSLISGIWVYDEELTKFRETWVGMEYCFPEGADPEATKGLFEYFNKLHSDDNLSDSKKQIEEYLKAGADANLGIGSIGRGIFNVLAGNVDLLELFIAHGATVDVVERRLTWHYYPGCTPLHKAILNNYEKQAIFLKNITKDLNFHFNIAVQHSIDSINSMANNGTTWKNIYKEYCENWGLVINKLLEWNVSTPKNYIELEKLLSSRTTFCEQRIKELKNISAKNWDKLIIETISIFSISQLDILIKKILFCQKPFNTLVGLRHFKLLLQSSPFLKILLKQYTEKGYL